MPRLEERVSIRYGVNELIKAGVLPEDGTLLFVTAVVDNQGKIEVEFIVGVGARSPVPKPEGEKNDVK